MLFENKLDRLGFYGEYGRDDKAYYLFDLVKAGIIGIDEAWTIYENPNIFEKELRKKYESKMEKSS